jgi:hypothetical protein
MDTRHLIDAVVQQTTLLIAQLATRAGIRAPMAHIADQIFLELSREIEHQGVSRSVTADMFGMALRSYQKKVNRLSASMTQRGQTLWQAILDYIGERSSVKRAQVIERFAKDDEGHVIAVLSDLVASGLLFSTGRGQTAAYRAISAEDRKALLDDDGLDGLLHFVWLQIADAGSITRSELHARFEGRVEQVERVLETLVGDGCVQRQLEGAEARFSTSRVLIPVDSEAGWETAVLDHYRAVCVAISSKLANRDAPAKRNLVGGATLAFEVHAEHPHTDEVLALLGRVREQANELWERVSKHNRDKPVAESERTRVVFYFGQNVIEAGSDEQVVP